jgi:hypothetical protein
MGAFCFTFFDRPCIKLASWNSFSARGRLQEQLNLQIGGWSDPSFWLEDILLTQDLIYIYQEKA